MTVAAYPLGTPLSAAKRGGDCRARDLTQARNVFGPHRFATTTACRISNGLVRVTVGASGVAPSLTIEAWRGEVTVGDVYVDVYDDLYGGTLSTPAWMAIGTLTIDSTTVPAMLDAVKLARISPEALTIRLVAPIMADAFVTLRRGERHVRIQHGSTRPPVLMTAGRRIRLTASPSPVGAALVGRVEESSPAIEGLLRYVGATGAVTANAGAFSLTSALVTSARFGAGVGTTARRDRPADMHRQLADATRSRMVVT